MRFVQRPVRSDIIVAASIGLQSAAQMRLDVRCGMKPRDSRNATFGMVGMRPMSSGFEIDVDILFLRERQ